MTNLLPRDRIGSGMDLYGTMNAMAMAISPAIGDSVSAPWISSRIRIVDRFRSDDDDYHSVRPWQGGSGIMCSVCQSHAMLLADKNNRGLANSTYYVGLDIGMVLGPIIGGILYGNVDIAKFYPILAITVPMVIVVDVWQGWKGKME